jgi:aspartyl-tRNA(Asn)/glutamyl-tRNA(Gln) amidotransferase subunit C
MKISLDEVQYVARLARLQLADDEAREMAGQLDRILSYVDKLNELDTTAVAPTTHAIAIVNAFREDEPVASLTREVALANGPSQNGSAFVVPKVI